MQAELYTDGIGSSQLETTGKTQVTGEDEQRRDITDEAGHALGKLLGFLQWD